MCHIEGAAMSAYGDITAMATLLGGKDPDDTEAPGPSGAPFNPSALPVSKDDGVAIPAVRPGKKDTKAIWDVSELVDDFDDDSEEEGEDGVGLSIPTYEFLYKQAINTADAFLGMAHNKDPGTRSCEDMVLKISLPGTKSMRELDLEVETDRLRLRSATYKLNLYLPHKVDADEGKAEWDAKSETLKVSCPILDEEYRLGT
jgi:hypothetical protein|tara:strand:+ start:1067 stop:1669 length:603 start_codon:yes stop_codon:yes gene_type:complete